MKYINKKNILFFLIFILLVILFIAFSQVIITRTVSVSEDVIQSIYADNNFDYSNYLSYINSTNYIDNSITTQSLKKVYNLRIDASKLGNSNFFKHTTNLKELTIINYQNLTKKNLENLRYLESLQEIHIELDGNYALKHPNYKINLSGFPNLKSVYITCNLPPQFDEYISYNLIKNNNVNTVIFNGELTIAEIKKWDSSINDILISLEINKSNKEDALIKIANYIKEHLNYDDNVNNYLLNYTTIDYAYKITEYNTNLLGTILNDSSKTISAICCNYAAMANVLLYKAGIEAYYITGSINNMAHAWNMVNINNNNYFMDLTLWDTSINKNDLLITNTDYAYQKYSNYSLPSDNTIHSNLIYYNNASNLIIKWNNNIMGII